MKNNISRIPLVDGLRGFALLGIILAHYGGWHQGWSLPQEVNAKYQSDLTSQILGGIDNIFISGKFFAFFSFLFGVSFGLMLTRTSENQGNFLKRFAWRLFILGIIGFVHHLHWRGDILSIYAIIGFFLLLFVNASNKVLLISATFLILNIPARLQDIYFTMSHQDVGAMWNSIFDEVGSKRYLELIRKGQYLPFLADNLAAFPKKMMFQVLSGRLYITFGFFLLGFWFSKNRLFENFEAEKPFFRKLLIYSSSIVGAIILIFVGIQFSGIFNQKTQPPDWLNTVFSIIFDLGNGALVMVYVAGMSFLFSKKSWQKILENVAVIGKIALTSYLTQTLLAWFIFFGFGLNLLGNVPPAVGYLIGIGVFLLQIIFSKFWLKNYYYGLVEWLWRSLSFLKMQPFVRK